MKFETARIHFLGGVKLPNNQLTHFGSDQEDYSLEFDSLPLGTAQRERQQETT